MFARQQTTAVNSQLGGTMGRGGAKGGVWFLLVGDCGASTSTTSS